MTPFRKVPQLKAKIKVIGSYRNELVNFAESLGLGSLFSDNRADVIVVTEEGIIPKEFCKLAYPYCKECDTAVFNGKEVLSYAVEDNGADVVAKNVRKRDGFVTFELLSADGIGRVYVDGDIEKVPKLALALACGLMLAGIPTKDAIAMVSNE